MKLRALNVAKVERFLSDLQEAGLSPGTAVRIRATLSKALSDAMRDELIHRNVAQIARPPSVTKKAPVRVYSREFAQIVEALAGARLGLLFEFAVLTGLRASELRGLRWEDVDLDEGSFEVHQGLHRVSRQAQEIVGDTGIVEAKP